MTKGLYHLKTPEREVCKALYRTGTMTIQDARAHFAVSEARFKALIKEGYLKKHGNLIRIGNKGVKYLEAKVGMQHPYRSKMTSIAHDLKLNQAYLSLSPDQRETWKTEGQIKYEIYRDLNLKNRFTDLKWSDRWRDVDRSNFLPDAAVYSESARGYVVIESITSNYSAQDIEQKVDFANYFYEGRIIRI